MTLKVKELIVFLQTLDQEASVGYEDINFGGLQDEMSLDDFRTDMLGFVLLTPPAQSYLEEDDD